MFLLKPSATFPQPTGSSQDGSPLQTFIQSSWRTLTFGFSHRWKNISSASSSKTYEANQTTRVSKHLVTTGTFCRGLVGIGTYCLSVPSNYSSPCSVHSVFFSSHSNTEQPEANSRFVLLLPTRNFKIVSGFLFLSCWKLLIWKEQEVLH